MSYFLVQNIRPSKRRKPTASQMTENVNTVYGPDVVTANHTQFRFRFALKCQLSKIFIKFWKSSDRHVSIAQELNIAQQPFGTI